MSSGPPSGSPTLIVNDTPGLTFDKCLHFFKESHGDWLAVPHGSENGQALKKKYEVTGIPCLVVLKADGSLITKEGRNAVQTKGPAAVKEWK